jgi:hypothetical protein
MITNKTSRKRSIDTLIKAVLLLALTIGMPLTGYKTTRKAESTAQQPPKVKLVKNNTDEPANTTKISLKNYILLKK